MRNFLTRIRISTFLFLNAAIMAVAVIALTIVAAANVQGGASGGVIAIGVIATLLALGSAWWLTHRLARPLQDAATLGKRMVRGDLAVVFNASATGEVAEIQQVMEELKDKLAVVVRDVRSGSIAIDTISQLITNDNTALSVRNETQASSHEETAASLEELSATVKNNAANAAQANFLVTATSGQASKGGEVVGRVVETMASIKQSSDKIVDIISVIDGIAFQTNILALNAAVEAARAGEQGRGFAVVAAEVRNLAQRSAGAAKEIKELISNSVERVQSGSRLVDEAGKTMSEIVTSVQHVAGFMNDIATASQEQSIGIAQVSDSITQLDSHINENNALVENALRSAATLKTSAATLALSVEEFKLPNEAGSADEAVALVKKCIAFAQQAGAAGLCEEVNRLGSKQFLFKDLYIVIYDEKAKILAHGTNRHFVGADAWNSTDPDGKLYNRDLVNIAFQQGSGWVNYKFAHPVSQQIMKKSAYVERFDDIVIACGCYAD